MKTKFNASKNNKNILKKVLHKNKIYAIIHISSSESVSPDKGLALFFCSKK
jgi:UDP-glucose 4-epimerase